MFVGNRVDSGEIAFTKTPAFPTAEVAEINEIPVRGVRLVYLPDTAGPVHPGSQRRRRDRYAAFSQKCTHLSCAVYYSSKNDRLECPCHQGFFSVKDGSVLQVPHHALSRKSLSNARAQSYLRLL